MAALAHAVVAGSLALACWASPPKPPPEGAWFFRHTFVGLGQGCAAVLDWHNRAWQLVFESTAGNFTADLSSDDPSLLATAGAFGTLEIAGSAVDGIRVWTRGDPNTHLVLTIVDMPSLLASTTASGEGGVLWLHVSGLPPIALPLNEWRGAIGQVVACAS
jgi:hypothetical protein